MNGVARAIYTQSANPPLRLMLGAQLVSIGGDPSSSSAENRGGTAEGVGSISFAGREAEDGEPQYDKKEIVFNLQV